MDIRQIDQKRQQAGISQKELCARAGVHATTYSRRKAGAVGGQVSTLQKLSAALDALIAERREAEA